MKLINQVMKTICAAMAFFSVLLAGCKEQLKKDEAREVKYNSYQTTPLVADSYFSDIKVVSMETNDQCLISSVQRVELVDSLVIIGSDDNIFLFNTDGRFISRVGRQGRGPGEYLSHRGFFVSADNIVVLDPNNGKLNRYDLAGKFVKSDELPSEMFMWGYSVTSDIKGKSLVFNQHNPGSNIAYTIANWNNIEDSKDLDLSYNPIKLDFAYAFARHPMASIDSVPHLIMPLDNRIYEYADGSINPIYAIDTPEEMISKEDMAREAERTHSYIGALNTFCKMGKFGGFTDIFETDNYIFLHYLAKSASPGLFIFDKRTNTGDYFAYPLPNEYATSPMFPISTCDGNRLLSIVPQTHAMGASFSIPQQLKAYVEAMEIPVGEILAPLRTMLELTDENNNPFLVFYTVK